VSEPLGCKRCGGLHRGGPCKDDEGYRDDPDLVRESTKGGKCGVNILGSGSTCARKSGHYYPEGKKLCTSDESLADWLDSNELPIRTNLSAEAQAELAERIKAERPGYRLGDQVHGPWCELIHEENRWWDAFISLPVTVECGSAVGGPDDYIEGAKRIAGVHAVFADAMIAEAKKRGRI
jgi:hypothetical protein